MIDGFLKDKVFKERYFFKGFVSIYILGHLLDCKELILRVLILYLAISDPSERYSKILIEIPLIVIHNIEAVRLLIPVHIAEFLIEIWISLQNV